ncbi:MAG: FAD-dependent monooxygenase, partial [Rhodanobacteraceae bacterium]
GYLLGCMRNGVSGLVPSYRLEFTGLRIDEGAAYPVEVELREVDIDMPRGVRARYVVGCDGAHSAVRAALGRELHGDRANHAWGVMDILPVTDFPDIRLKAAIQSSDAGSILLIPREGGYLVRLYVDLGVVTDANRHDLRGLTAESVVGIANRVLHRYRLEVRETAWFSIYEVAQRLTDAFDDAAGRGDQDPRVFIAGDACHTHSAQAGQGMNVSMADAFNLGWKLAAVLRGQSDPALLRTYSAERQPVAQELIDFDREWATLMATRPRDPANPEATGTDPDTLRDYYARGQRYTMGIATRYPTGLLTGEGKHQSLAAGFPVGMRFHSAPVVRLADARRVELGHVAKADGRWRLYLFADREEARLRALCDWLADAADSPIRTCTPARADIDAVIDVRAVLQRPHREVKVDTLPALLLPHKGRYGLADYEKVFCARGAGDPDVYAARDIDRDTGCALIVRPDQYVSEVLPLDDHAAIRAFFARVLRVATPRADGGTSTPRIEAASLPA